MKPSLFRSGLAPRLGAAALFGLLAFGAVLALDQPPPAKQSGVSAAPERRASVPPDHAATAATLCIESIEPVGDWMVRVDGSTVTPRESSPNLWIAGIQLGPSSALVIDAEPATPAGSLPRTALRIRIAGTSPARDTTFWCARSWSVTTRIADLAPSASPIEPADLP